MPQFRDCREGELVCLGDDGGDDAILDGHGAHDLEHQPAGRCAESRSILNLSTACPATPRSPSAATAYLSDRPNWLTFHSKQDCVPRPQAYPYPTTVPIVRPSNCVSAEVLNIAAARVAPRRAGRQAELPDRQPADAA